MSLGKLLNLSGIAFPHPEPTGAGLAPGGAGPRRRGGAQEGAGPALRGTLDVLGARRARRSPGRPACGARRASRSGAGAAIMSTAMNFGSKSFQPRPPDKGSFPLDHFGERQEVGVLPRRGLGPRAPPGCPGPREAAGRSGS